MTVKGAKFSFEKNDRLLLLASKEMGKSTLLKVLSGFDETYLGSIKLNGKELKEIDDKNKTFSLLLSDPVLFENKSIKFNLDYLTKTINMDSLGEEKIIELLKKWHIDKTPNYKIKKLSLLEKRLFCLMRSCLKNPTILFLDDQLDKLEENDKNNMIEAYKTVFEQNNAQICAFSESGYKNYKDFLTEINFKKVLYLCDGDLFVFDSIKDFETSYIRKNIFEFVEGFNNFEAIIYKTESAYYFCQEGVREIEINKRFYKNLDGLKLDAGDAEKVSVYFCGELKLEDLSDEEFDFKVKNGQIFIYSNLDGTKLF